VRILITGGSGFLGKRLTHALLERRQLVRPDGRAATIDSIVSTDIVAGEGPSPSGVHMRAIQGDLSDAGFVASLFADRFDVIFHLASLVSGGAERDFEQGFKANLQATLNLLEGCRLRQHTPTFVFTSSIATYGGELPEVVDDDQALTPETSYGAHKGACELLVHDYSRKGYVDGRSLRLPIIIIRPGAANTAVSGFASSMFREPLRGLSTHCPLEDSDSIFVASARRAVEGLIRSAESPASAWGSFRAVTLPGRAVTIAEMIDALRQYAGNGRPALITRKADPQIQCIVNRWPKRFDSARARAIGFADELALTDVIDDFVKYDWPVFPLGADDALSG
jgi:nucleoside-diphosphate-sugar epimerase